MSMNWIMKPDDMIVYEQMQQAIYTLYTEHKGNREAYKTAVENLAVEKLPQAPDHVRQTFIKFALDVFDKMESDKDA